MQSGPSAMTNDAPLSTLNFLLLYFLAQRPPSPPQMGYSEIRCDISRIDKLPEHHPKKVLSFTPGRVFIWV